MALPVYYVVSINPDGEIGVEAFTKSELLRDLEEGAYANFAFHPVPPGGNPQFWHRNAPANNLDAEFQAIIIKGNCVTPEIKEKAITYDID